jgi:hypothetical protein
MRKHHVVIDLLELSQVFEDIAKNADNPTPIRVDKAELFAGDEARLSRLLREAAMLLEKKS